MLDIMNRYIHGYVAIPVILACREKGFLRFCKKRSPVISAARPRVSGQ